MYFGGICFITDRTVSDLSIEDQVRTVLDAGIRFVQYREKSLTRKEILRNAEVLRRLTQDYGAKYIVNDHCDISIAVDADGAHLGQDDLPLVHARRIMGDRTVGISTHSLDEALLASAGAADYIGFGPMYNTTTKDAGRPKGTDMLNQVRKHVHTPIVAIGGIEQDVLVDIFDAGADAVALASYILKADDPYRTAKRMVETVKEYERKQKAGRD
ncbi:MAG: thiamine phosphate synthase [Nitrospirota bacterium]|nr:MAG: thiamine phosphate synthase [Nitrospirota bacterium]